MLVLARWWPLCCETCQKVNISVTAYPWTRWNMLMSQYTMVNNLFTHIYQSFDDLRPSTNYPRMNVQCSAILTHHGDSESCHHVHKSPCPATIWVYSHNGRNMQNIRTPPVPATMRIVSNVKSIVFFSTDVSKAKKGQMSEISMIKHIQPILGRGKLLEGNHLTSCNVNTEGCDSTRSFILSLRPSIPIQPLFPLLGGKPIPMCWMHNFSIAPQPHDGPHDMQTKRITWCGGFSWLHVPAVQNRAALPCFRKRVRIEES